MIKIRISESYQHLYDDDGNYIVNDFDIPDDPIPQEDESDKHSEMSGEELIYHIKHDVDDIYDAAEMILNYEGIDKTLYYNKTAHVLVGTEDKIKRAMQRLNRSKRWNDTFYFSAERYQVNDAYEEYRLVVNRINN